MTYGYKHTIRASYLGYITQAIVNNLAPLLFVTFQKQFGVSYAQIGTIITVNFGVQIVTDLVAARYIDRIGWRVPVVVAHVLSALGLVLMGILPGVMGNAYAALLIAMVTMAIGGGLIEVLISPIVESCPGDEKASAMSLLHSFYCWGHVSVVLLSTLFFKLCGIENWKWLFVIWAAVPAFGAWLFTRVPLRMLVEEHERVPLKKLFSSGVFWVLLLLMVAAGASEQAMSQWSSLFAEMGLGVSKTMGDLLGPCAFAVLMGLSRAFYGIKGAKIKLDNALMLSAVLCVLSYLLAVFAPHPLLSLVGCGLCGLSVGIMWPGATSLSARSYPQGGTALFAMLAFAGDVGCMSGPGLVGVLSEKVQQGALGFVRNWFPAAEITTASLKCGLMVAIVFPVVLLLGVMWIRSRKI